MPPRFKPFTSFLTQGMNNTNKNINNMNQPSNPGISNPLSKSFTGGGQQIMGGEGWGGHWSEGGGEGEPGGSTGPGGYGGPGFGQEGITPVDSGPYTPPEDPPVGFTSDDYWNIFNDLPPYMQNQINQEGGINSITNSDSIFGGLVDQFWTSEGWSNELGGWWSNMMAGLEDPSNLQTGEMEGQLQGETGEGYYQETPMYAPTEFAGGGGQGGEAAKKLYYPGTQGGFASVGSGIGGQQNMLDDLLMKLKG